MLVDRALMFVHMGMDVEDQWEKAVHALQHMTNLEIAMAWRRLSSRAPIGDFRVHSEYKCLFKRAVREAEGRAANPGQYVGSDAVMDTGGAWDESGSCVNFGSVDYEWARGKASRHNSGISALSRESSKVYPPFYSVEDKNENARRLLDLIREYGISEDLKTEILYSLEHPALI
jgi:hypothetical protein